MIVVGNWMLLNMAVAILMDKFTQQKDRNSQSQLIEMKAQFVARFAHLSPDELNEACLSMFSAADADGSGVIEKRELQKLLFQHVNLDLPERMFLRLFRRYDTDRSGEIGYHEFLLMFNHLITDTQAEIEQGNSCSHQQILYVPSVLRSHQRPGLNDSFCCALYSAASPWQWTPRFCLKSIQPMWP